MVTPFVNSRVRRILQPQRLAQGGREELDADSFGMGALIPT